MLKYWEYHSQDFWLIKAKAKESQKPKNEMAFNIFIIDAIKFFTFDIGAVDSTWFSTPDFHFSLLTGFTILQKFGNHKEH